MELNKVNGDILGAVATEDITEGRMVLLTSHTFDHDFGSLTDLPGAKLPTTAAEASRARFIVTWPVDNRQAPYYTSMPSYAWSMRKGAFDQAANMPFNASVSLIYPGYKNGVVIPSGTSVLAYGAGTFTVPSGAYLYSASLVPGASLSVSYSGADKGKLQYQATWDATVVGSVYSLDATTGSLTFTTKEY
jgi:hypothetical protein